jgi:hypothetical protein
MVVAILRKKGENQQGGGAAEKQRPRPLDQFRRQKQSQRNQHNTHADPAAARMAAQREFDEAKELARRQFNGRMERIHEYEQKKPMDVYDTVWKQQIDNARKTVQHEYEHAQEQAREEYQRVLSRLPAAPPPPARKIPKSQPKQPVAVRPTTPQPQPKPSQSAPTTPTHSVPVPQTAAVNALAYHLSFTKDDLTRGILYSEILSKPLALREHV